jgi:hypothetical protein
MMGGRRGSNRVELPVGPFASEASSVERVLVSRVQELETVTGLSESSGQEPAQIIQVGGGTTEVTYNVNVSGSAGTTVVIGGTGEVASGVAGLPSTVELQGFYGHAVGASLRSTLTSAGHSLQGVYSSDGSTFRPIDSLSTAYAVPTLTGFGSLSKHASASGPDFDVPTFAMSHDYHTIYLASAGVTLALDGGTGFSSMRLYELFDDGTRTEIAGASVGVAAGALYLGDDRTSGYGYFAARSSSTTDEYYLDGIVADIGNNGVAVYYVDFDALYTAWQSSGVVQSLRTFHTLVGASNSLGIWNDLVNVTNNRSNPTPWAGALTGHSTAYHFNIYDDLYSFDLTTGAASKSTMHLSNLDVEHEDNILIASPRWGNSTVDVFLGVAELADGAGGQEYRIVKHGTWGYVDITPVGSGVGTVSGFSNPGVVPLSDSATMFFGGAPTHVTWYHPADGGTVYVDLSTL